MMASTTAPVVGGVLRIIQLSSLPATTCSSSPSLADGSNSDISEGGDRSRDEESKGPMAVIAMGFRVFEKTEEAEKMTDDDNEDDEDNKEEAEEDEKEDGREGFVGAS